VWNRESASDKQEYFKNKKKTKNKVSERDLYYKYVKEGDKEDCDMKYLGLMFFIAGTGVGMAPQFRDGRYGIPIHQYHLFNVPGLQSLCAGLLEYELDPVKLKLVKTIHAIFKVNISDKSLTPGSTDNLEEGNSLPSPAGTTTKSPDAGSTDALDESISVSSTMLIETEQGEMLEDLMNNLKMSPSCNITDMATTNTSSYMANVFCLENEFEDESSAIFVRGKAFTVAAVAAKDTTKEVSSDSSEDTKSVASSEDIVNEVTNPIHEGVDEATLKLVQKLAQEYDILESKNVLKAKGGSSPTNKNKDSPKGVLKNIHSDLYSTPLFKSRTRKGIIKGSTSSIDSSASTRGQEEKKSFIKKITTLQAIVDGKKAISVTVVSPMRKNQGSLKLKAKPAKAGMDLKASMANATLARKQVAGDDLQTQGKYRKFITNEWIQNQFILLMEINRLLVQLGRSRNYLLLERVG
jgi:hypothetical protein